MSPITCLVTGGGGFVGKALCKALINQGHQVRSLSRSKYPELEALGVTQYSHDLSSNEDLPKEIFDDVEVVFHTAAHVKMWGAYDLFYKSNVEGTRNLLAASKKYGVNRFIYTSSPSVIADGTDLKGVDETYPYPKHFEANYPKSKALAEQEVLQANSADFFTCALRPHLIFGEDDTNLIPTVVNRAKAGSLRKIGNAKNLVDFTYIEDCVKAHILAAEALLNNPESRGKAYFISQGDPYPLWQWIDKVLIFNNLNPLPNRTVSKNIAMLIAAISEFFAKLMPALIKEPRLTRFLVSEMATDHYFDISRASSLLGYKPSYTVEQALEKTFAVKK